MIFWRLQNFSGKNIHVKCNFKMAIFNIYRDRENSPKNAYFCKIINYTGVKVARKKKELPFLEKVTIKDVAAEGKAIAKIDDLVVFVPFVVPGDVVDLQVKRKKNKYAEAEAV
ncbi:MAG: TRAM domain-containing protein, partial [Bacteroides graminisolvens]|nr:TRAM domain-containing protein [Bacteroides graminisolvens]